MNRQMSQAHKGPLEQGMGIARLLCLLTQSPHGLSSPVGLTTDATLFVKSRCTLCLSEGLYLRDRKRVGDDSFTGVLVSRDPDTEAGQESSEHCCYSDVQV
jgi:hypothetical protein